MMKLKPTTVAPLLLSAVLILTLIFSLVPEEALGLDENPYLSTVIIQLVIFMLPSLFFCTFRGSEYSRVLRLRMPSVSCILILICALLCMICGSCVVEFFMSLVFPESMAATASAGKAAFAMNSGIFDGLYLVLAFAVLPAATEEFLFRGIILAEYGKTGIFCSVMMSSLAFAMCHLSLARLPVYFFCGIILAIVAYATRSVIATMIVHAVYNIFVLFFEGYIFHLAEKQNINAVLFIIIAAGIALLAASFMCFEASALYKTYALENLPSDYVQTGKKKRFGAALRAVFSPTFISFALIYIIVVFVRW